MSFHTRYQLYTFGYRAKIDFFDAALVCTGCVYPHKPDKVVQRNATVGIFTDRYLLILMFDAVDPAAVVYQAIITRVMIQMGFSITLPFFSRTDVRQFVIAFVSYHCRPDDPVTQAAPVTLRATRPGIRRKCIYAV